MLSPLEVLAVVAVVALIWILLKPDVVVRWGRGLGRLVAEFKRGEEEDEIVRVARELGIETEGRSRDEIAREVERRLRSSG